MSVEEIFAVIENMSSYMRLSNNKIVKERCDCDTQFVVNFAVRMYTLLKGEKPDKSANKKMTCDHLRNNSCPALMCVTKFTISFYKCQKCNEIIPMTAPTASEAYSAIQELISFITEGTDKNESWKNDIHDAVRFLTMYLMHRYQLYQIANPKKSNPAETWGEG